MNPQLGVCYYPEHWPQERWAEDARRMRDAGLSLVRIGEFSWSQLEPDSGQLQWQWLDTAVETLGAAGLEVVLGTPTATPPRWMLHRHPDMLAVDANNNPRKFGSRRHYCFSHEGYRQESARIANLLAERYGKNPYLAGWQIDNEYGCHDTVVSYSDSARLAFQRWLADRYGEIAQLNKAWGNRFWSMEYSAFTEIDLPNLTVTEPNPAHLMDFRRFSSDQVVAYNRAQVEAIRRHSGLPLIHNYMGRITDFDHFALGEDLEIASWDSYPLGFLEDRSGTDEDWKLHFYRQGDPDMQAFHHDLYRAVGRGRWWIMEQQPGPVNWAPHNPAPLPGMVRLWTWEAFAHQAEAVCYFRWRQAPFAQEQMHAGLLRPDAEDAAVMDEVRQVRDEIQALGDIKPALARVALMFDYESCWASETQPQGQSYDYFALVFCWYRALRRLGITLDILPPSQAQLEDYSLVLIPGLMHWTPELLAALDSYKGVSLIGPRSGAKTANFQIPTSLPPNMPGLDVQVTQVESLRAGAVRPMTESGFIHKWIESLEGSTETIETLADGTPILVGNERMQYLAGWPDDVALNRIFTRLLQQAGLTVTPLPEGLRQRATGSHRFLFNYNNTELEFEGETIEPAGVRWFPLADTHAG